jgi:hypothetical protein
MFLPLRTRGTDTEERGVRGGGGGGGMMLPKQRENQGRKKSRLFTDCRTQGHLRTFCLNQKM